VHTGAGAGTGLAYTGSSPYVAWLAIAGMVMVLLGAGGRRRALAQRALLGGLGSHEDR
jgi:hypothetical protein